MSDLGRRVDLSKTLDIFLSTAVEQGYLPSNYSQLIGNNNDYTLWSNLFKAAKATKFAFPTSNATPNGIGLFFNTPIFTIPRNVKTSILYKNIYTSKSDYPRLIQFLNVFDKGKIVLGFVRFQNGSIEVARALHNAAVYLFQNNKLGFNQKEIDFVKRYIPVFNTTLPTAIKNVEKEKDCTCPETQVNGLYGGKIADPYDTKTKPASVPNWVKPVVAVTVVGGVGFGLYKLWRRDQDRLDAMDSKDAAEVMKARAYSGAAAAILSGKGKKSKKSTSKSKGLGKTPNKGLQKMLAINKSAKALQHQSGYEMRNVKEVEVKTVKKSMPKLSWKEAQKRAKNLYK